jgi:hypothetical protein
MLNNISLKKILFASFLFCLCWVTTIIVIYFVNLDLLISVLEAILSNDGHISFPQKAIFNVLMAPVAASLIVLVYSIIFKIWSPEMPFIRLHFIFFIIYFTFFFIYSKFLLKSDIPEGGILETATFVLALVSGILFCLSGFFGHRFAFLLGLCWLIFAFEEVSWGQRIFGFGSPNFFATNNLQGETNIHNFFNQIFLFLYITLNFLIFSTLTWFREIQFFKRFYEISSISFILKTSDTYSLWFYPFVLTGASVYPGFEFVEEQWAIFGLLLSTLLLFDAIKDKTKK